MAITCNRLHYSFTNKANHSNNEYLKSLNVAQIDMYLQEAQDLVFEKLVKVPEIDPEIRNHLRQLEKKNICIPCQERDGYVVMPYPADFYRRLRQVAIARREGCNERELIIHILQSDKISESLKSPYWKPSYEYEETVGDDGEEGLYVWHNGEFEINRVCIDYIRKPEYPRCPSLAGGYKDVDGNFVTTDVGFELDATYIWRMVVDVAVLLAKRDVDDVTNFNSQLNTIIFKQGGGGKQN